MRVEKMADVLHVYLEEKNYRFSSGHKKDLLSKVFLPEITICGFPIRDKKVFLHIKRRRWLNTALKRVKLSNEIGKRDIQKSPLVISGPFCKM